MVAKKTPKFWVCRDEAGLYYVYNTFTPIRADYYRDCWHNYDATICSEVFHRISKIRLKPGAMKREPVRIKIW